jgi:hypothetical protein
MWGINTAENLCRALWCSVKLITKIYSTLLSPQNAVNGNNLSAYSKIISTLRIKKLEAYTFITPQFNLFYPILPLCVRGTKRGLFRAQMKIYKMHKRATWSTSSFRLCSISLDVALPASRGREMIIMRLLSLFCAAI